MTSVAEPVAVLTVPVAEWDEVLGVVGATEVVVVTAATGDADLVVDTLVVAGPRLCAAEAADDEAESAIGLGTITDAGLDCSAAIDGAVDADGKADEAMSAEDGEPVDADKAAVLGEPGVVEHAVTPVSNSSVATVQACRRSATIKTSYLRLPRVWSG